MKKPIIKKELINPAVKKGDVIILLKARNGQIDCLNIPMEVITERSVRTKTTFNIKNPKTGLIKTIYYTTPSDEFILATRENEIEYLKIKNIELNDNIIENNNRIKFLIEYKTEEDFVADKLDSILTAHSENKTKGSRVKAISCILKELKESNLL